jgi:hypothetical protein
MTIRQHNDQVGEWEKIRLFSWNVNALGKIIMSNLFEKVDFSTRLAMRTKVVDPGINLHLGLAARWHARYGPEKEHLASKSNITYHWKRKAIQSLILDDALAQFYWGLFSSPMPSEHLPPDRSCDRDGW